MKVSKEDKAQIALGLRVQCGKCKCAFEEGYGDCPLCDKCCVGERPILECEKCYEKYKSK